MENISRDINSVDFPPFSRGYVSREELPLSDCDDYKLFLKVKESQRCKEILERGETEERFSPEEIRELRKVVEEGRRAEEELLRRHQKLVYGAIRSIMSWVFSLPEPDLWEYIQEGMLGLVRAIRLYDPERGVRFSTYAYVWIRLSIRKHLSRGAFVSQKYLQRRVLDFIALLDEGRSFEEAQKESGISETLAREAYSALRGTTSLEGLIEARHQILDTPKGHLDNSLGIGNVLTETTEVEELVEKEGTFQILESLVEESNLSPKEREFAKILVREMRGGEGWNLSEVARALGVTRERARQLERSVIVKLREHYLRNKERFV